MWLKFHNSHKSHNSHALYAFRVPASATWPVTRWADPPSPAKHTFHRPQRELAREAFHGDSLVSLPSQMLVLCSPQPVYVLFGSVAQPDFRASHPTNHTRRQVHSAAVNVFHFDGQRQFQPARARPGQLPPAPGPASTVPNRQVRFASYRHHPRPRPRSRRISRPV